MPPASLYGNTAFETGLSPRAEDWSKYRNNTFFERAACAAHITDLIERGNISGYNTDFFAFDKTTQLPLSGPENMTVTLLGCEALCGPRTFYVDSGPRFMTWVLPSR